MNEDQITLTDAIDKTSDVENKDTDNKPQRRGRPKKSDSSKEKSDTAKTEKSFEVEVDESNNILSTDDLRLSNDSWNIMGIYNMYVGNRKILDFDIPQQRAVVWKKDRKSAYIHSILCGLHKFQPSFIVNRVGKGKNMVYKVYDGKQRMLGAIISYINGEFALCGLKNDPLIECDGKYYDVNGAKYAKLPQPLKDRLTAAAMNVLIADNASEEIMQFIMLRVNSGEMMTPFDVARIRKSDMSDIESLANHGIFNVMLTEGKISKKKYQEIIVKTWISLYEEEPKFSGKHINDVMSTLQMTEAEQENIKGIYDKLLEAYNILVERDSPITKIVLNKTNFTTYLPYVNKFDNAEMLADWMEKFFTDMPEEYREAITGHSTTAGTIKQRYDIISQNIDEFLG